MTPGVRSAKVHAFAKINLSLRVLGIRTDGYHELRTTFQSISLRDTLTFERTRTPFELTCTDRTCPADETNLVWKTAQALWRRSGRSGDVRGVRVHLTKRVPSQAGLGGGSSDAAATLRALSVLWNVSLPLGQLEEIARSVGADVPYFLHGGTALGVERGDVLYPLRDIEKAWVVVARPDFGVSTRDAFGWWDAAVLGGKTPGRAPLAASEQTESRDWQNDLESYVCMRHPAIARLVKRLKAAGASTAAMSGSGSAVFALFDQKTKAERAAAACAALGVDVWIARTITAGQYQRMSRARIGS